MKLAVHVLGREIGRLEPVGDFKSVFTYHPEVAPDDFVSLTMPVRTESYAWDEPLHPIFQMNLPEGYLLQVLQEEFGPHIGADPTALLAVVGRNMIGRLQVAAPGAELSQPPQPVEVAEILAGDNSEQAFAELVRQHATSGVSGILPKFLDNETAVDPKQEAPADLGQHQKTTLLTHRHIIKGSSRRVPFAPLNEHLCMQVASQVLPSAKTRLSKDGKVIVVERFDVDEKGQPHLGMEDFCVLLGLRPAAKYETTWERIAKAIRDHVPGDNQYQTFRRLTVLLLLTYALRNADAHAKNIALVYTSRRDVQLAPAYDFLTTSVYAGYQDNPPGISFMGKRTWSPGKNLSKFAAATFGIPPREQSLILESISDAVSTTAPAVREMMDRYPDFRDLGKRMLLTWQEAVSGLRSEHGYSLGVWKSGDAFRGFSDPPRLPSPRRVIGRSPLLGRRSRPSE